MLPFLKKDLKLILRDRGELVLLLLMPLLLIAILGFALGGLLGGSGGSPIHLEAALVVEDDIGAARTAFREELGSSDIPLAERTGLLLASQLFDPIEIVQEFLNAEDLQELMTVRELSAAEAAAALAAGELHATVTVPAGFGSAMYRRMLLEQGESASLQLELGDEAPLSASVVRDVLQGFATEFNLQTALQQLQAEQGQVGLPQPASVPQATGGTEVVGSGGQEVSSFAYYAVGMAVMFMLYLVGSTASRAYLELSNYSFDRVIIAGAPPLAFLASKAVAAALVGFAQIMLLLFVSNLLFGAFRGQGTAFWGEAAVIAGVMALTVGAMAALVTATVFRANNKGLADAFNSVIVFVFALVGGSFVPVGDSGSLISRLGDWTPNGATLTAMLSAAQGAGPEIWGAGVLRMAVLAVVMLVAGLLLFPRMRSA